MNPLIIAAGVGAVTKLAGSLFQSHENEKYGDSIVHQADIALQEAKYEASLIREDGRKFAAEQSLQYIGAGFELGASALLTLDETRTRANEYADSVVRRAEAQYGLAVSQKKRIKRESRAQVISSLISGAGSIIGAIK